MGEKNKCNAHKKLFLDCCNHFLCPDINWIMKQIINSSWQGSFIQINWQYGKFWSIFSDIYELIQGFLYSIWGRRIEATHFSLHSREVSIFPANIVLQLTGYGSQNKGSKWALENIIIGVAANKVSGAVYKAGASRNWTSLCCVSLGCWSLKLSQDDWPQDKHYCLTWAVIKMNDSCYDWQSLSTSFLVTG